MAEIKTEDKLDREVAKAKANALPKSVTLPKKRRGRPPKKAIDANTAGKRNAVGRPKGEAGIMNDFKARLLASPKSTKVVEAIFDAALDDNHKGQQAAWKLLMDRMMPVSMFEKEIDPNGGSARPVINISIGTVGGTIDKYEDYIDGELEDA
jgi:hypothetical protein